MIQFECVRVDSTKVEIVHTLARQLLKFVAIMAGQLLQFVAIMVGQLINFAAMLDRSSLFDYLQI